MIRGKDILWFSLNFSRAPDPHVQGLLGISTWISHWECPKWNSSHVPHKAVTVVIFPFSLEDCIIFWASQDGTWVLILSLHYSSYSTCCLSFDSTPAVCPHLSCPFHSRCFRPRTWSPRPASVTVNLPQTHTSCLVSEPLQHPFNTAGTVKHSHPTVTSGDWLWEPPLDTKIWRCSSPWY